MFVTALYIASSLLLYMCPATAVPANPLQGVQTEEGSYRKLCPPSDSVPQPAERVDSSHRLRRLREEMRKNTISQGPPIDAYIITTDDAHQSEYVAERDERLKFLSGFTGYGTAVVTETRAALWTDGRYILQADNQLDCEWLLMGRGPVQSSMPEWITTVLKPGGRVGADPTLVSSANWERWAKRLAESSVYLLPVKTNLVDLVWGSAQPQYSRHEAYVWKMEFAGMAWLEKLALVRTMIEAQGCDVMVVTALDEIAWLLNIRGRDIPYSPVLRAYVVVTKTQLLLYVPDHKLSKAVRQHLQTDHCYSPLCARIHNYSAIWEDLRTLSQVWKKVLLPAEVDLSQGVSRAIYLAIPVEKRHVAPSPIMMLKSQKNPTEKAGMRKAHLKDAAAFCDFMAYFEEKLTDGENWDELKVAMVLDDFRRIQFNSEGISFRTIVGFGPHAAWPHYVPTNVTTQTVDRSSILLIDSGGHYLEGTTDVTRTFHLGTPTDREIDIYTRVLMGCIDLAMLRFPPTLPIRSLDVLARAQLWQAGKDYRHGTGHGIGTFGSVHESPINIHWWNKDSKTFRVGYFFTEEPGFYQEGQFGVRLENVLEVVQNDMNTSNSGPFLGFETITLIPFEPKLINRSQLSPQQIQWLNDYSSKIRRVVGAELKNQRMMQGFRWMMARTNHIPLEHCTSSVAQLAVHVSLLALLLCFLISRSCLGLV